MSFVLRSNSLLGLRPYSCLGATAKSYAVAAHACVSVSPPNRITTAATACCIPTHKQSTTTPTITSRSIMICIKGILECDHEDVVEDFGDDCDDMGSNPYPYYKKERLTKKERRAMKSSGKVGKVANNRVKALIDVVQLKRYYQYLT